MNSRVFFVDEHRKNEINQLRRQEYASASGFSVELTTLDWKQSDNESFIMAAEVDNQLIATMRGEVISDLTLLEQKLECPWSFPLKLDMPVLLLSRAATKNTYRSIGFNLILRYWFLRFAAAHCINFVIGTFTSGAPREKTLREMGYQIFENKLGWQQSTYRSLNPVLVAALNLQTQGQQALDYCLERLPNEINQYHFKDEFPSLRLVRSL